MTLNMSLAAFTNEIHTLSERPSISSEIEPHGTKPPVYNSVHDLLKSNYNYNVRVWVQYFIQIKDSKMFLIYMLMLTIFRMYVALLHYLQITKQN